MRLDWQQAEDLRQEILGHLEEHGTLTTRRLARRTNEPISRVRSALNVLYNQGKVAKSKSYEGNHWRLVKDGRLA